MIAPNLSYCDKTPGQDWNADNHMADYSDPFDLAELIRLLQRTRRLLGSDHPDKRRLHELQATLHNQQISFALDDPLVFTIIDKYMAGLELRRQRALDRIAAEKAKKRSRRQNQTVTNPSHLS